MSDNALGEFLRDRRAAITPADVGLPSGVRRRTPGLRRAELATLAGISVEYLTRLEQGRDRQPSPQVLTALADALRLTTDERLHLGLLAKATGGGLSFACPGTRPARSVRPTVRALLDRLEPAPALVLNRFNDLLAWTTGYERLAAPLGVLDAEEPNLIRFVFADARARTAFPDWERIAGEHVALLKLESARRDPLVAAFTDELAGIAGALFTDRMRAPATLPRRTGVERWHHPEAGELRLAFESLELPDAGEQRLLVYLPADDVSSSALDQLTGRHPGALRMVAG
ncbi:helix-turn-helix domain-containing protein [Nonomuraea sp. NPDC047897]|uniref:helix-turn-helix domain-containing protein n=1 Tax=Nonomuraea sp. NPDC047897 TaxID=3364346 RepID=UPI00371F3B9F